MPRSSRRSSSSAPSRSASTSSVPSKPAAAPPVPAGAPQQGRAPGFMSQVASTAAGVAAGHGLSNMLFGGSSTAAAPVEAPQNQSFGQQEMGGACTIQAKDFTQCLNATGNDINSCAYYLDQLKACQQAASAY